MSAAREAALRYLELGMSVIPITPGGHVPLITWKMLQTTSATAAEINDWYRRWPDAGVGIVTGAVSGIVVLDTDPRNGPGLPLDDATTVVATPRGGYHFYYAYDPIATTAHPLGAGTPLAARGLDVQSDRAYVIAPPSVRNRKVYQFVEHTEQLLEHLPPLPDIVVARLRAVRDHTRASPPALPTARSASPRGVDITTALRIFQAPRGVDGQATWMAKCPLHEDHKASLAVSSGADGRVLLYCHAGCHHTALFHYLRTQAHAVTA